MLSDLKLTRVKVEGVESFLARQVGRNLEKDVPGKENISRMEETLKLTRNSLSVYRKRVLERRVGPKVKSQKHN